METLEPFTLRKNVHEKKNQNKRRKKKKPLKYK